MEIPLSRGTSRVPQLRSPLLPSPVTGARCFQKGYLVRTYRAWTLFLILSICSSTAHPADTRPHSRTTLAYEPITHTSFINSTHAIYREADHAPTCAYRLLSFPSCPLGSHNDMTAGLGHSLCFSDGLRLVCVVTYDVFSLSFVSYLMYKYPDPRWPKPQPIWSHPEQPVPIL